MSETVSAMMKFLIVMSSTKANIRYICIPIATFFSWKYFGPVLSSTDIPTESIIIIVFLLGIGSGSLIGSIFYKIYTFGRVKYENSKEAALNELLRQKEEADIECTEEAKKAAMIKKIEKSFDHLTSSQQNILVMLTKNRNRLDCSGSSLVLLEHDFIRDIAHIQDRKHVVEINPIISDFLKSKIDDVERRRVTQFLESSADSSKLLSLLEVDYVQNSSYLNDSVLALALSSFTCIQGEHKYLGIRLFFVDDLKNAFEKYTGKSYLEEVLIPRERIRILPY